MVVSCCAFGCKEKADGSGFTFHCFPKDEERKKRWVIAIRRKDFVPSSFARICSKHFTPECFDTEKFGGTWLKKDAVPTIFDFPSHLQIKVDLRAPTKKEIEEHYNTLQNSNCVFEGRKTFVGDFNEDDMNCPRKAHTFYQASTIQCKKYSKKVKHLHRKTKLLEKKISSLQEKVAFLKKSLRFHQVRRHQRIQQVTEITESRRNILAEKFPGLLEDIELENEFA